MKRLFSGVKPTGNLHLGNYLGALKQWSQLQHQYESIFSIVDLHAITASYKPSDLKEHVFKCACSYLACGIDPENSLLMIQSQVKAHSELTWFLNCITPISWLERVPTYKEKAAQQAENLNLGLLDYPVLMTADIILYKAEAVPVGEDQLPHIELAREIVRRFNNSFGETFPEPKGIIGKIGRIKGLDGSEKMGKSLDNCIYLYESKEQIWSKISKAVTDPARIKRTDPGNPEICNIFTLHKLLSSEEVQKEVIAGCTTAGIGCIECKKWLTAAMDSELSPIRDKYFSYLSQSSLVSDILLDGANKANLIADRTMVEIYEKTGFAYNFGKTD